MNRSLKMEKVILEKTFSIHDQIAFASFSGDFNPIHISSLYARRSLTGTPIVHGINLFLCSFNALATENEYSYEKLHICFYNPLPIDQRAIFIYSRSKESIKIISSDDKIICNILLKDFTNDRIFTDSIGLKYKHNIRTPVFHQKDIYEQRDLDPYFSGEKKYALKLYPNLTKSLGIGTVSQIASLSEIIGMQVPGLNSLLTKCSIKLNSGNNKPKISIKSFNKTIGAIKIECRYQSLDATLSALFRPEPVNIPFCSELIDKYNLINLSSIKAIIIGGSRGIGAWIAKLIAIGGGEVLITYRDGLKEANETLMDIENYSCKCQSIKFDVLKRIDDKEHSLFKKYNSLFYFASPKILVNNNMSFNENMFKEYKNYYVDSFEYLTCHPIFNNIEVILYPSTIFIDKLEENFREYTEAKIQGERLCKEITINTRKKIFCPRYPRMLTDQTISFTKLKYSDIGNCVLPNLKEINSYLLSKINTN